MSTTVDNRVVQMSFDNAQFESRTKETMSTLDKLKEKLDFSKLSKSFDQLNEINQIDFRPLTDSFDQISLKIGAFEVAAMTAISRITNAAINAGERLVKSLTLDNIEAGFSKYEKKVEAVQTIMVATGKSIEDVNTVLDKLNDYTDETSYSFTEMVGTIGKFTSAGVDLETAEDMVEGIANWAASAGVSARNAGPAFYNLAQAVSTGALKAQDWKSIELLNMSTADFKNTVIDTAVELGVLKKGEDGIARTAKGTAVATNAFNQTLSESWINAEVLAATLHKYADTSTDFGKKMYNAAYEAKTFTDAIEAVAEALQTGWSKTFELIFGNYEEAKVLWTEMANNLIGVFDESIQKRNDLLLEWNRYGGRFELLDALASGLLAVNLVVETVKTAFANVFGELSPLGLYQMTKAFSDFVAKLVMSEETFNKVTKILEGVFSVFSIGGKVFSAFGLLVSKFLTAISPITREIGSFAVSVAEYLTGLNEYLGEANTFANIVERIADTLDRNFGWIIDVIANTIRAMHNFFNARFKMPEIEGITEFTEGTERQLRPIGALFSGVGKAFDGLYSILSKTGPAIVKVAGAVGKAFDTIFGSIVSAFKESGFEGVLNVLKTGVLATLAGKLYWFIYDLKMKLSGFGGIATNLKYALDELGGVFESFSLQVKVDSLFKIAGAIAILTGSLLVLSTIDGAELARSIGAITVLFAELLGSMVAINKFVNASNFGGGITGVLNKVIDPRGMSRTVGMTATLMGFATAVLVLAGAMKLLSTIPSEDIDKGLFAIAVAMGELIGASVLLSKFGGKIKTSALSMMLFAGAVDILTIAVKSLSKVEWPELIRGLVAVGVVLAELAAFMYASKFGSFGMIKATAIIELAAALLILADAVKKFGQIPFDELWNGLIRVGAILAEVAVFSTVMGDAKHVISTAIALGVMSLALGKFAKVIEQVSKLTWGEMIKGLVGLGVVLGELTIALNMMNGTIAGSLAMVIAAGALGMLVPVLERFGKLPLWELIKALLGIAGALAVFGIGAALLTPIIAPMLGVGAALFAMGAGLMMASIAITTFITSLNLMAVTGTASMGLIIEMVAQFISGTVDALFGLIPAIVDLVLGLISALLKAISDNISSIVDSGMTIIMGLANGIMQGITVALPTLIQSAIDLGLAFINGLADGIDNNIDAAIEAVNHLAEAIGNAIIKIFHNIVSPDFVKAGIDGMNGLAEGLGNGVKTAVDAAKNVGKSVLDGLAKAVGYNSPWWTTILIGEAGDTGLATGLYNNSGEVYNAGAYVGGQAIDGMEGTLNAGYGRIIDNFQNFVRSLMNMNGGFIVNDEEEEAYQNAKKERLAAEKAKNQLQDVLGGAGGGGSGGSGGKGSVKKAVEVTIKSIEDLTKAYKLNGNVTEALVEKYRKSLQKGFGPGFKEVEIDSAKSMKGAEIAINRFAVSLYEAQGEEYKLENQNKLLAEAISLIKGETKEASDAAKELAKTVTEGATQEQQVAEVTAKVIESRIQGVLKAFNDYRDSIASAVQSSLGFFEAVQENENTLTGDELLKNAQDNLNLATEWKEGIKSLQKSEAVSDELINYLMKQGIGSKQLVDALLDMTEEDLEEYNELYKQYLGTGASIGDELVAGMVDRGTKMTEAFVSSINPEGAVNICNDLGVNTLAALGNSLNGAPNVASNFVDAITTTVNEKTEEVVSAATEMGEQTYTEVAMVQMNPERYRVVGVNLILGLLEGIKDSEAREALFYEIDSLCEEVSSRTESGFGVESPSKVFAAIGKFLDMGLAKGINDNISEPISAIDNLSSTIGKIANYINGVFEFDPVITPTLDLSNVAEGARGIADLFNKNRGIGVFGDGSGVNGSNGASYTFIQNNNSPKALSRIDIYRQTKNQFAYFKEVAGGI